MPSIAHIAGINLLNTLEHEKSVEQGYLGAADGVLVELQQAILRGGWEQQCSLHGPGKNMASLPEIDVFETQHGGKGLIRGLMASKDFAEGQTLLVVPKQQQLEQGEATGERFDALSDSDARLTLLLAERKNQVLNHPSAHPADPEHYWKAYIESLPSLEEYRSLGLPLLATNSELHLLENLPIVGPMAKLTLAKKAQLLDDLYRYNSARGARDRLHWKDALWSAAVISTRVFACDGDSTERLGPAVDFINDAGNNSNAEWRCDSQSGALVLSAKQPINRHQELTMQYMPSGTSASDLFSRYGLLDSLPREQWGDSVCSKISELDLTHRSSPFLRALGAFTQHNCKITQPVCFKPSMPVTSGISAHKAPEGKETSSEAIAGGRSMFNEVPRMNFKDPSVGSPKEVETKPSVILQQREHQMHPLLALACRQPCSTSHLSRLSARCTSGRHRREHANFL